MDERPLTTADEEPSYAVSRRAKVCIWIIILGLLNFLAYTLGYLQVGGDAMNGYIRWVQTPSGRHFRYFLLAMGQPREVGRAAWIFSAVHAISIWITVGAVLLAMLTLAKAQIVSSMRSSVVRGRTLITILATVVTLISVSVTLWFALHMIQELTSPQPLTPPARSARLDRDSASRPRASVTDDGEFPPGPRRDPAAPAGAP